MAKQPVDVNIVDQGHTDNQGEGEDNEQAREAPYWGVFHRQKKLERMKELDFPLVLLVPFLLVLVLPSVHLE
jgi:hypothetical protein